MTKLLIIAGVLFSLSVIGRAQASSDGSCPEVMVSGPAGISEPGKPISFSVTVDTKGKEYPLAYKWTVSDGSNFSGQATDTIQVPRQLSISLTATVEIKGLPDGCRSGGSASADITSCPPPVTLLDEFVGPLTNLPERIDAFLERARGAPNSQIFIVISGGGRDPSESIKSKRAKLSKELLPKLGKDQALTFVESDKDDDRVQIYLVPAGAEPPKPE